MGSADRYADGEWNFYCDLCGRKEKSSKAVKTWDNHYVCAHHKEVRNPQDFLKGVKDDQSVPWSRPTVNLYVASWGLPITDTFGNIITGRDLSPLTDIGV